MNNTLSCLEGLAAQSNLLVNENKTKQMLITSQQTSNVHDLNDFLPPITVKEPTLERVTKFKLLGIWFNENQMD